MVRSLSRAQLVTLLSKAPHVNNYGLDVAIAHGDTAVEVNEARFAELADIYRWRREWSINGGGPEGLGWDDFVEAAEAGGPGFIFSYRTEYRFWLGLMGLNDDVLAVLSIASDPNRNRKSDFEQ